jgi:hypothetical protein
VRLKDISVHLLNPRVLQRVEFVLVLFLACVEEYCVKIDKKLQVYHAQVLFVDLIVLIFEDAKLSKHFL